MLTNSHSFISQQRLCDICIYLFSLNPDFFGILDICFINYIINWSVTHCSFLWVIFCWGTCYHKSFARKENILWKEIEHWQINWRHLMKRNIPFLNDFTRWQQIQLSRAGRRHVLISGQRHHNHNNQQEEQHTTNHIQSNKTSAMT